MISGRFEAAADEFEKALSFARMRRAGLEGEARILADLANAIGSTGTSTRLDATAVEAIDIASARSRPRSGVSGAHRAGGVSLLTGDADGPGSNCRDSGVDGSDRCETLRTHGARSRRQD